MNLEDAQARCTVFWSRDPENMARQMMIALAGEAGELSSEILKLIEAQIATLNITKHIGTICNHEEKVCRETVPCRNMKLIAEEAADCLVYLLVLSNILGFSLMEALESKFQVIDQRVKDGYYGPHKVDSLKKQT